MAPSCSKLRFSKTAAGNRANKLQKSKNYEAHLGRSNSTRSIVPERTYPLYSSEKERRKTKIQIMGVDHARAFTTSLRS